MEEFTLNFTHLEKVLQEYGETAKNDYKEYLEQGQKNTMEASLYNSVEFEVKKDGARYEVRLNLLEYWKYVESGRRKGAKFPPIDAIRNWMKIKPVLPYPDKKGKLPTPDQLSFLIARGISENGIKPFPAMKQTTKEVYDMFVPKIMEAWYEDVGSSMSLILSIFGD